MRLSYFDTSALAKLVMAEVETQALRVWVAGISDDQVEVVTSRLADVELIRAAQRHSPEAVSTAERVLESVERLAMTPGILAAASRLRPVTVRTLDAIHVASAQALGSTLHSVVAYDVRLRHAAEALGLPTAAPR